MTLVKGATVSRGGPNSWGQGDSSTRKLEPSPAGGPEVQQCPCEAGAQPRDTAAHCSRKPPASGLEGLLLVFLLTTSTALNMLFSKSENSRQRQVQVCLGGAVDGQSDLWRSSLLLTSSAGGASGRAGFAGTFCSPPRSCSLAAQCGPGRPLFPLIPQRWLRMKAVPKNTHRK